MAKQGKPRSRANGEGSIWKRTDNGRYTAQYTTPEGKRIAKTFATQREAREWLTQQRHEVDIGEYVNPSECCCQ